MAVLPGLLMVMVLQLARGDLPSAGCRTTSAGMMVLNTLAARVEAHQSASFVRMSHVCCALLATAQADAAREARRGAAAQIAELESRAAADKANIDRWVCQLTGPCRDACHALVGNRSSMLWRLNLLHAAEPELMTALLLAAAGAGAVCWLQAAKR